MTKTLFEQWFRCIFLPNIGAERPVLLLMDNHGSHISKAVSDLATENEVFTKTYVHPLLLH
jgi:hypothetical protein